MPFFFSDRILAAKAYNQFPIINQEQLFRTTSMTRSPEQRIDRIEENMAAIQEGLLAVIQITQTNAQLIQQNTQAIEQTTQLVQQNAQAIQQLIQNANVDRAVMQDILQYLRNQHPGNGSRDT